MLMQNVVFMLNKGLELANFRDTVSISANVVVCHRCTCHFTKVKVVIIHFHCMTEVSLGDPVMILLIKPLKSELCVGRVRNCQGENGNEKNFLA